MAHAGASSAATPTPGKKKGRFVAVGCYQKNAAGLHDPGVSADMFSSPINESELRGCVVSGIHMAYDGWDGDLEDGEPFDAQVADEENAYVGVPLRTKKNAPIFLDLKAMPRETRELLVPPGLMSAVDAIIAAGGTPCVEVVRPLYGLVRAGFDYEASRNDKFIKRGLVQIAPSIFKFSITVRDRSKSAVLGAFVDDHVMLGFVRAVAAMIHALVNGEDALNYGDGPSPLTGALGLSVLWTRMGRDVVFSFDQHAYGAYWTNLFEEETGNSLFAYAYPGCPIKVVQPGAPNPKGFFASTARTYVGAALFAARMTLAQLLFPCVALSRRFDDWGYDEDRRITVLFGYWKRMVTGDKRHVLELRVNLDDIKERSIDHIISSDSDHAGCPFSRRSTSGSVCKLVGDHGTRCTLDFACKSQPAAQNSSGAAEVVGISHAVHFDEMSVDDQLSLVRGASRTIHAAGVSLRRTLIPTMSLLEDLGFDVRERILEVDASTAVVATSKGYSRLLQHLDKTAGVNLACLSEAIRAINLKVVKLGSEDNDADLFTACRGGPKFEGVLPRIGIIPVSRLPTERTQEALCTLD